jgi:signal transduction histidine kinase
MNLPKQFSGQKSFSYPFYLFSVLMVLIGILTINGYFELQRTRSHLFNLLESEALLVIKGLEKNSGNLIAVLSQDHPPLTGPGIVEGSEDSLSIEDLLVERLINLALQLDQEAAQDKDSLQSIESRLVRSGLSKVYFLKPNAAPKALEALPNFIKTGVPFFQKVLSGRTRLAIFRGEGAVRHAFPLALAVARSFDRGIILILLSFDEYVFLSRQIIIQSFLEDFSGKGNITYLRVEDQAGKVIAQTGERFFEVPARNTGRIEIRDSSLFRLTGKRGDFLEVVRPFRPAGKQLGLVRLGLSLKEVNPILDQSRRNIILMGMVLFGLGMISLFYIFRLQGRHLQKMKELEKEISLKEELAAMGQLAAGVAHEIKNPLNAISLVVQRLEKEFIWEKPEEQKEYDRFTRIVRNEIARVNRIIGDFLMMAKPLDTKLEDQSLFDILEYVLEIMEEEFQQKHIRVIKEWDRNVPLIRCDRFQLTQAFINIFNNALEAMPEGGDLHLTVKTVQRSAPATGRGVRGPEFGVRGPAVGGRSEKRPPSKLTTPYSELNRDFMEISIADTGKGIPPERLPKIFAPYYTTKERGVGLGLAITQRMIQAHEGSLEVQSLENQGTTVIVRLPFSPHP